MALQAVESPAASTTARVAVVVPLYNAGRYIDATLQSIRAQTVADLDIVVVDDGSTDSGPHIVERHAEADPRVRLIRKENGGVAAARNRGAAASTAPFIAFVDADDLWAADKVERQLARFQEGGESMGLVYCWFVRIDDASRITGYDSASVEEGDVLPAICARNLVGNGSSVMIRRSVFDEAGGYDPSLRARGLEGCEDYDLYARIAGQWKFGLVRDFLVGYRITVGNMSSNLTRMAGARAACAERLLARHPQYAPLIKHGRRRFMRYSLRRAIMSRDWVGARRIAWMMLTIEPVSNLLDLPTILLRALQLRRLPREQVEHGKLPRFKIGKLIERPASAKKG